MFCIDLWGFSIDPSYFGYNSAEQETVFSVFWRFRDLSELKLIEDFYGINILPREASGDQEVKEEGHEAQTSIGGVGPWPGHATHAQMGLVPLMSPVFISDWSAWPKNAYIKTPPEAFSWGGSEETRNHEIEVVPAKIGGGNAARVTPDRFFNLSDITNTDTIMKRE
jgi:hypothetical protein